jgi:hypothetical protein
MRVARALPLLVLLLAAEAALAAGGGGGRGGGGPRRERGADRSGIEETGLRPVFPPGYACLPVTSAFAASTDGEGHARDARIHGGRHGGMDISLPVGTPLVAIAAGDVVSKGPGEGSGAAMEGIFLWLRHAPEDTGLPFWTFSKYQHLRELPGLAPGDRVAAGQVIAVGGDTGTYSQKFAGKSLPHLHMSTFIGPGGEHRILGAEKNMVQAAEGMMVDTMLLFVPGMTLDGAESDPTQANTPKQVPVAVADRDGRVSAPGARLVWPVSCEKRK